MLRSLMGKLDNELLLAPVAVSASVDSASIDTADFGSMMINVCSGAFAYDGSNLIDIKVQHCDDNATWADCAAEDLFEPEAGAIAKKLDEVADGEAIHSVNYVGYKRYVRIALVVTGTVSALISCNAVKGHLETMPAN